LLARRRQSGADFFMMPIEGKDMKFPFTNVGANLKVVSTPITQAMLMKLRAFGEAVEAHERIQNISQTDQRVISLPLRDHYEAAHNDAFNFLESLQVLFQEKRREVERGEKRRKEEKRGRVVLTFVYRKK
jgi:hypothetical protein